MKKTQEGTERAHKSCDLPYNNKGNHLPRHLYCSLKLVFNFQFIDVFTFIVVLKGTRSSWASYTNMI